MTLESKAKKYASEVLEHSFYLDFLSAEVGDCDFKDELERIIASAYIDGFLEEIKEYINGSITREQN